MKTKTKIMTNEGESIVAWMCVMLTTRENFGDFGDEAEKEKTSDRNTNNNNNNKLDVVSATTTGINTAETDSALASNNNIPDDYSGTNCYKS